jgi:hypothetical protein
MPEKTLVYLACPYSDENPAVRVERFEAANRAAGALMRKGLHVFSPISHTHPIAVCCDLPLDWEFWQGYDRAVLAACCKVIVLTLPGWKQSRGIAGELEIAREFGLPVSYMSLEEVLGKGEQNE